MCGAFPCVGGEVPTGLSRLRNAAALRALSSAMVLALQPVTASLGPLGGLATEDLASLYASLGVALLIGAVVIVIGIAAWLLRVLGWGNLCRAKLRRFYCLTRVVVIAAPIAGVAVIGAGVVVLVIQALGAALSGSAQVPIEGFQGFALAAAVLLAAPDIFEAVASFDLGQTLNARVLTLASLALLAATPLGAASSFVQQLARAGQLASLAALALLAAGYHVARDAALRSSPGGGHEA